MNTQSLFLLQATYPLGLSALQIARLNFLNETIAHYNSNNRATVDNSKYSPYCTYWLEDGRTCAIGRGVPNEQIRKKLSILNFSVENNEIQMELPSDLLNLGITFLFDIQTLHDAKDNWNQNGLSTFGIDFVNKIKKQYNLPL